MVPDPARSNTEPRRDRIPDRSLRPHRSQRLSVAAGQESHSARVAAHDRYLPSIAAGGNVKVVQQMLGHATGSMTLDLYGHLFPDQLDDVADRLGTGASTGRVSC